MNQTLNALTVSKDELLAYTTYYQMLLQQKSEGRLAIDLTNSEESKLRDLAESEYDIAFYAKSLLEWAKDETWHHEIEESIALPISFHAEQEESFLSTRSLGKAIPNPTADFTSIISTLLISDLDLKPQLVIRDMQGMVKARFDLKEIYNETKVDTRTWQPGIYLYSLELNHQIIQTKKLSIQK